MSELTTRCRIPDDKSPDGGTRVERLPGLHVLSAEFLGPDAAHELDPLHITIDLQELGISGYQVADWLRAEQRINVGLSGHRRIGAQLSYADSPHTTERLLAALTQLVEHAADLPRPKPIELPDPSAFDAQPAMLPRDAFFAEATEVPAEEAAERISVEQITPYPPGIPAVLVK